MRHISDLIYKPDSIYEAIVTKGTAERFNKRKFPRKTPPTKNEIVEWLDRNGFTLLPKHNRGLIERGEAMIAFNVNDVIATIENVCADGLVYNLGLHSTDNNSWIEFGDNEQILFIRTGKMFSVRINTPSKIVIPMADYDITGRRLVRREIDNIEEFAELAENIVNRNKLD